jgi:acylphosphatase
MIARRAVVSGRVQGVGFRFFASRTARELGVSGWVRNLPDGSVETLAEGSEEAVASYLQRLREGPGAGKVASIVEEERIPHGFSSFEITR